MDEIEQFKKQNGNVNYTVKELIGALHVKIDQINTKLESGESNFSKINTTITWHTRLITCLYSIMENP